VAAILGSGVATIDGSIVNVALPAIERDLGGGSRASSGSRTRTSSPLASLILLGGSLGDIYGERRVFAIGIAAFGAWSRQRAALGASWSPCHVRPSNTWRSKPPRPRRAAIVTQRASRRHTIE
jgi:MFS family permease